MITTFGLLVSDFMSIKPNCLEMADLMCAKSLVLGRHSRGDTCQPGKVHIDSSCFMQ